MGVTTSIVLDTRRIKKKTGKYPVRLSVIFDRKPKQYQTVFDISREDFDKLSMPRITAELRQLKDAFQDLKARADLFIDGMEEFSFQEFERDFISNSTSFRRQKHFETAAIAIESPSTEFDFSPYYRRFPIFSEDHTQRGTISGGFIKYIKTLLERECIGSAFSYQDTYNSIKKFRGNVRFKDITPAFLHGYEKWMLNKGYSITTVGIKLRPLRAIFNQAIKDKIISRDYYPFGNDKYEIPTTGNRKKALSKNDIGAIFRYDPPTEEKRKAKAFWIFSYLGNGMNLKDVINLKVRDYQTDIITFVRAKTKQTSRKKLRIITVVVTAEMQRIIEDYGFTGGKPNDFLFPVLNKDMTALEAFVRTKSFIKFVDDNMKQIGVELGLNVKLTSIVARHSFSTILKRSGYSTEFIMEALGHSEPGITNHYLDSFETQAKIEASKILLPD